jgi:hypothetical protein
MTAYRSTWSPRLLTNDRSIVTITNTGASGFIRRCGSVLHREGVDQIERAGKAGRGAL